MFTNVQLSCKCRDLQKMSYPITKQSTRRRRHFSDSSVSSVVFLQLILGARKLHALCGHIPLWLSQHCLIFGMRDGTQNRTHSTNRSKSIKWGKLMCVLRPLKAVWLKCLCFGIYHLGNPTIKCDYTKLNTEKLPPSKLMWTCPLGNVGLYSCQAAAWVDCLLCLWIGSNVCENTVVCT